MNKRIIIIIIILIIAISIAIYFLSKNNGDNYNYFPPQPTQVERVEAKKLPKDQCPCWVEIEKDKGECHPQADCI